MAEVVAPPLDLDLDGSAVAAQVVEFIGGITLGAIQSLGEAMDRCAVDDDDDSVFYDATEAPHEPKSVHPDPVGASCEGLSQATGGEAEEESCSPRCDADGSEEQQKQAACKELPNCFRDKEPLTDSHGQGQEEADRPPSEEKESESSASRESGGESSTQLLVSAETEMLGQPKSQQSCEPVSSGNDKSGESLSLICAELTLPECESEKFPESQGDDGNESTFSETEESAESSSMKIQRDSSTLSLVAKEEDLPLSKCTDTNAEPIQSTCIESGESLKYCCNAQESEPNVKSESVTSALSVCTESGETIQHLCDHKPSEAPLCQPNEELAPSSCQESRQSTLSGSISDGEGLEPSQTSEGQSVCEALGQPDNSASLQAVDTSSMETEETTAVHDDGTYPVEVPGQPECERSGQPDDFANLHAAATSSMDVSDQSAGNQRETEETICPTELPDQSVCEGSAQPNAAGLHAAATSCVDVSDKSSSSQQETEETTAVPDDGTCPVELPDQSVCEGSDQPSNSAILPEAVSGLCSEPKTDGAAATPITTTSSTDVCDTNPTDQHMTGTAVPDDSACTTKLSSESVCELLAPPDNSRSLPEGPSSQLETDSAVVAPITTATSSMDVCDPSSANQQETKETSAPDDGTNPATELPGESVCEALAQPDNSNSVPEVAICPDTQAQIDSAAAAIAVTTATSSMDICNTSPTNQSETAVPDDSVCPAELPGKHDNVTTEGELSGGLGELHSTSTEPQRLISKETQTEILEEATAMSQIQQEQQEESEQEKATIVEAVQEEQAEGVTGGCETADSAPTPGAAGEDNRPDAGLESSGDISSGDDLTADSQDETLDAGGGDAEEVRPGSGSGSPPLRGTASLDRRKKPLRHHSFNKSKYSTVSYRKIRKGNTRQRIDEFEAMMNM